jgi:membrane protein DedA with SNARE-associated domain
VPLAFALAWRRRYITPRMLHSLLHTWLGWVENWGYLGVVILMAMESSIFPVPSEVVIPPAAILAASSGRMSLAGVIVAGTFGSWLGSAITYWVSLFVGRPVVEKWGKYFFIPPEKLERAERFMHRYEAGGIFFARLLPVIRHLISIPAGIIRMGFGKFSVLTTIGAGIWCGVLAWLGGKVGGELRAAGKDPLNPEELVHAVKHESHWIIGAVVLVCVLYFAGMKMTAPKRAEAA